MVVGVLRVEVHLPRAQSLKAKRSVLKSLKDQIRGRFNVSVAEVDANDLWQRATIGVSTVGENRAYTQARLREVAEWIRATRMADVIHIDEEYVAS